ncbi:MAG: hypothetical protein Q7T45_08955 [Bradyrhizobium sp.]|uniref:hypothetical protein n=1 Tax=Bradyrhizobium sp. TaxID=376 RepID=UPI002725BEC2|nr:hypothetical protein [Bradyrhizobium sp.]MDO8397938.1 hypothetical protein [Bradyrhizobium sp.]
MRASTAYFAGAGTVIVAIVGGIGGGLLFADIVSPKAPKQEMTRLEQRMSSQPIDVKAGAEPTVNPGAPPSSTTAAAPIVPEAPPTQPEAKIAPAATPRADTVAATQPAVPVTEAPASPPAAQKQAATAPEDSLAKAKDIDIKRAATEKRRGERRRQWSEKRRYQRREDPDQELREVEAKVREETETTGFFGTEPVRSEGRRIRIIDLD